MANNLTTPALPVLKQSDLKDPTLIALNQNLSTLWQKVVYLAGGSGAINVPNDFSAQSVSIPNQQNPPTDPNQALTLGSALALFAPGNSRAALLTGAFKTNPTTVDPVQPIPLNGGSGMSGTINFPGGFTIGATTYFNMVFKNGLLVSVS